MVLGLKREGQLIWLIADLVWLIEVIAAAEMRQLYFFLQNPIVNHVLYMRLLHTIYWKPDSVFIFVNIVKRLN